MDLSVILAKEEGKVPLGKGAGGDKTFPVDKWAEDIIVAGVKKAHRNGRKLYPYFRGAGHQEVRGRGRRSCWSTRSTAATMPKSGIPFFSTSLALLNGDTLSALAVGVCHQSRRRRRVLGRPRAGRLQKRQPDQDIGDPRHYHRWPSRLRLAAADLPRIMPLLAQAKRTRCFGSTALDLAYLASGAISVFATGTASRAFDYAAGMLILEEADGVITDLDGTASTILPCRARTDRTAACNARTTRPM